MLRVEGVVRKVLRDEAHVYMLVRDETSEAWVAIPSGEPLLGDRVTCSIVRSFRAFESMELGFAFESMHFADDFVRIAGNEVAGDRASDGRSDEA